MGRIRKQPLRISVLPCVRHLNAQHVALTAAPPTQLIELDRVDNHEGERWPASPLDHAVPLKRAQILGLGKLHQLDVKNRRDHDPAAAFHATHQDPVVP